MNPKLVSAAASPNTSSQDAHNLLIQAGISELQARAAKMPATTDEPLPITEQDFSAQIKASRQTRYMRISKWANYIYSQWIGSREFVPIEALTQIQFVAEEQYLDGKIMS